MVTSQASSNTALDRLMRACSDARDRMAVAEIETQVDVESARLWDVSASDLAEIERSLKELTERRPGPAGTVTAPDDIKTFQRVVVAIKETVRLMSEIERAIPNWPIE